MWSLASLRSWLRLDILHGKRTLRNICTSSQDLLARYDIAMFCRIMGARSDSMRNVRGVVMYENEPKEFLRVRGIEGFPKPDANAFPSIGFSISLTRPFCSHLRARLLSRRTTSKTISFQVDPFVQMKTLLFFGRLTEEKDRQRRNLKTLVPLLE